MRRPDDGSYRDGSRKRVSYANVVSTLALVIALGGGTAWAAAHHYSISSTKQIKPSVLKKLHGANGKKGAAGIKGTNGTNGAGGENGAAGAAGTAGTNGVAGTNGATGSTGVAGADGTALAYAEVHSNGTIAGQPKGGITMTPGTSPAVGIYCLDVPGTVHIGVASGDAAGGGVLQSIVEVNVTPLLEISSSKCAIGTTVAIHTYDTTGTAAAAGFFAEFN